MAENPNQIQPPERRTVRLIRPSVVVLCGPAGSGKSTFAAKHFRPTQIISSDQCRALVSDDERDQRFQTQAFALLHCIIEQRLLINRLCVVDSTAITPESRRSLIELARRERVPCVAIVFDVPLETCVTRDQERDQAHQRAVGRAVIERQHFAFEEAKAAIPKEGFDQVVALKDEDLGRMEFEILFRPAPRPAPRSAPAHEIRRPARSERRPGPASGLAAPVGAGIPAPPSGRSAAAAPSGKPSGPSGATPAPPAQQDKDPGAKRP